MKDYPFSREIKISQNIRGQDVKTLSGLVLLPEEQKRGVPVDPFRYKLYEVLCVAYGQLKDRHGSEFFRACNVIRDEIHSIWHYTDELSTSNGTESELTKSEFVTLSAPTGIFEFGPDEWLDDESLWGENIKWTWRQIYAMTAIWAVDEAVVRLEEGQIVLAAAWGMEAESLVGFSQLHPPDGEEVLSPGRHFSKLGNDAAHAENRKIRQRGIQLYLERTDWKSRAHAARVIAARVHRVETVVLSWIRDYHKGKIDI